MLTVTRVKPKAPDFLIRMSPDEAHLKEGGKL
jgi:hypothetical protein